MSTRRFVRLCSLVMSAFCIAISLFGSFLQAHAAGSPFIAKRVALLDPAGSMDAPFEVSQILHFPGNPAKGWCYDVGWSADGRYYLSNDSQGQINVVTIHQHGHDTLAMSLGRKDFMGPMGCDAGNYSQEGPEGIEVFHDQLWASDGNSSLRVFDIKTGRLLSTIGTQGKFRADEMSINPALGLVAVTNPDETFARPAGTPYLTFISTHSYRVVAQLPFPFAQAGQSGLQAPLWIGGNELLVDVPAPQGNNGGELDRVAVDSDGYGHYQAHLLHRYALTNCSPSGLALDSSTGLAAVGCAGERQIIWNVRTNRVVASVALPGVDIVAASEHFFFYPSYLKQILTITNEQGKVVQIFKTSAQSHTVTADPESGQVFVPLDGGNVLVLRSR